MIDDSGVTICFGSHFAKSEQFNSIFREGMELVETTAEYLDGKGRKDARKLAPPVSVAYATESMRLTTRLLDLASWLLIQRSLREGEITPEEAVAKREGMALRPFGRPANIKHFDQLPLGLQDLVNKSYSLSERIRQLDLVMRPHEAENAKLPTRNPVSEQWDQLQAAFDAKTGTNC